MIKALTTDSKAAALVPLLLGWYAENARDLPWRRTRDPYGIWVSEIMLQQTQVKTVLPFWTRWMTELPTIESAAAAGSGKIHKLWEGLGYYTRARNLHRAARMILEKDDGRFPHRFEDILALPGVGRYTAGAIASIAFNQPHPILDGNVIRVLTRIFGIRENPRKKRANRRLWQLAGQLVLHASTLAPGKTANGPQGTNNDYCSRFNQSLMELGASICLPRNPGCSCCPAKKICLAFKTHRVARLPNLGKRPAAVARHFIAFIATRRKKFLVRQRPENVVNAHLWEFPNVEIPVIVNGRSGPAAIIFKRHLGMEPPPLRPFCAIKHSITRYRIALDVYHGAFDAPAGIAARIPGHEWRTFDELDALPFTAAHRKILKLLGRAGSAGP
ncbi:MAG: A/G-specific adenine glycosylase [Verrucomicrobia bacterium]|nr:A/G-specific adenine glycosylase [Verrucomicrobiota bacterium]MDE3098291.1 A/G-specific adenine glycosylase [Verrucomicrobiota bacterium]